MDTQNLIVNCDKKSVKCSCLETVELKVTPYKNKKALRICSIYVNILRHHSHFPLQWQIGANSVEYSGHWGKTISITYSGRLEKLLWDFRTVPQTTNAIKEVLRIAVRESSYWLYYLIKNALNSASWYHICLALNQGLYRIIKSYLCQRTVTIDTEEKQRVLRIICRVRQGSSLGPIH